MWLTYFIAATTVVGAIVGVVKVVTPPINRWLGRTDNARAASMARHPSTQVADMTWPYRPDLPATLDEARAKQHAIYDEATR